MKLYGFPPSPNTWKVRAVAAHLGIPLEMEFVDLTKGGSRTPAFLARYDFRPVTGAMPQGAPTMDSKVWIRDAEPRTPDARSIAAICDAPFPSIWLRLSEPVMITTIAYNVFFRTSAAGLAAAGDAHLLLDSRCDLGAAGFFDQDTNVWSAAGALLAQTQQLAWFSNQPLKSV